MEYPQLAVPALLDLSHTAARPLLEGVEYPWQVLLGIGEFIKTLGSTLSPEEYEHPEEWVWVHKAVKRQQLYCRSLRHWPGNGNPPRGVYPGQRPGGRGLCGGQLYRAEKCHPL